MKKKGLLVAVGIVLVLAVVAAILLPKRIKLYNAINDNIETLGPKGAMFENYDVTDDTLIRVENEKISVAIPGGCIYEDREIVDVYNPNNLNQSYNVIIREKDRQQAYAIINSIELK